VLRRHRRLDVVRSEAVRHGDVSDAIPNRLLVLAFEFPIGLLARLRWRPCGYFRMFCKVAERKPVETYFVLFGERKIVKAAEADPCAVFF
jgi:hypothetical protein